jgi:hypothetical protein
VEAAFFPVVNLTGDAGYSAFQATSLLNGESRQTTPQICHPVLKNGMIHASYSPSSDMVGMPPTKRFDIEEAYHAMLFHELVHSTGSTLG